MRHLFLTAALLVGLAAPVSACDHREDPFLTPESAVPDSGEEAMRMPGWDAYKRRDYATATREFLALADQGDARAQATLGIMLVFDELVFDAGGPWTPERLHLKMEKLRLKMKKWLLKPDVSNKQNLNEAAKWFQDAAEQGDTKAGTLLGHIYDSLGVLFFVFGEPAPGGAVVLDRDTNVWHVYGRYREGDDVPQGLDEAMKLWRKAAEQGEVTAQKSLAFVLAIQNKVTESDNWSRKAAEQGDRWAQTWLGRSQGDRLLAYMWFDLAAKKGAKGAAEARDEVAKKLTKFDKIDEAKKLVQEWQAKHPWAAVKPGEAQTVAVAVVPPRKFEDDGTPSCLTGATFGSIAEGSPLFSGIVSIQVVDIEPDSLAWELGLRLGDAVVTVDGEKVHDLDEFSTATRKRGGSLILDILSRSSRRASKPWPGRYIGSGFFDFVC